MTNNPTLALAIEWLAVVGLAALLGAAGTWLRARFDLDCNPLLVFPASGSIGWLGFSWEGLSFGIPRRFRVTRRWDRPGALVRLPDGSTARLLSVYTDPAAAGAMATVQPESADGDDDGAPAWVPLGSLSPAGTTAPVPVQDGGVA